MLEWTRDAFRDSHLDESVIKVRNLAYSTLKVWLDSVKHSSGFHSIAEEFLPHFVKDISPPNINITTLTTKVMDNLINKLRIRDVHEHFFFFLISGNLSFFFMSKKNVKFVY